MKPTHSVAGAILLAVPPSASQLPAQTSAGAGTAEKAVLRTYPERVYFTTANAKEKLSASVFMLIVEEPAQQASAPELLELVYRVRGQPIRIDQFLPLALASVEVPNF